jgi:hypothetical protein
MTSDKPSQEFHLTPGGWISGTSWSFKVIQGEPVDRPPDAIETWLEEMVQAHFFCSDIYSWTLIWFDSSMSDSERRKVRKQFSKPAEAFPERFY